LGAALYVWHCSLNKPRQFILKHNYWGKDYSDEEIGKILDEKRINYKKFNSIDELVDYVTEALIQQRIVGWFQGRFEWGPRALGNRSILADPRSSTMKDTVNMKIKFREPFRPFAPSVLQEDIHDFFDIRDNDTHLPFKFMLYTTPVIKGEHIPAVTHANGTSRIQAVSCDDNPLYYSLIKKFKEKTAVPLVLNTSFNLKGEPIVNSPQDALSTFSRCGIDTLVLGNVVVEKDGLS